jgi:hypothetical protein
MIPKLQIVTNGRHLYFSLNTGSCNAFFCVDIFSHTTHEALMIAKASHWSSYPLNNLQ